MTQAVWVKKSNISDVTIVDNPLPPLGEGAARLRVESFAVTANNVTYAAIGDMFGYWNFFPADGNHGIVPMWGHAQVEASNCAEIAVGERLYGYLPMGTHLDVIPGNVSVGQFSDTTDYRQPMSPFYNLYSRLNADPEHDPSREAARMIYGPLFKTGFLIEAMFRREGWFAAEQVVMTSASSKTAMALAHCVKESSPEIRRVGLTSARNASFVQSSGLFDEIVSYDAVEGVSNRPSVLVDFAGNSTVLRTAHETLGEALTYSCLVGATHIEARGGGGEEPLPGPQPILFFAPDHATATVKELGPKGFGQAVGKSWGNFVRGTDRFVAVETHGGLQAAVDAFLSTVKGEADPAVGMVVRP